MMSTTSDQLSALTARVESLESELKMLKRFECPHTSDARAFAADWDRRVEAGKRLDALENERLAAWEARNPPKARARVVAKTAGISGVTWRESVREVIDHDTEMIPHDPNGPGRQMRSRTVPVYGMVDRDQSIVGDMIVLADEWQERVTNCEALAECIATGRLEIVQLTDDECRTIERGERKRLDAMREASMLDMQGVES